jgi:hypothetical protein
MICLRTTAHARSIDALPPTTRWCCSPIMRRHPCGHLNHFNCQHSTDRKSWVNCRCHCHCNCCLCRRCCFPQFLSAMACCWLKSPLTTNGGTQCHRRPLGHLWHERVLRILWATQMGEWHPRPCPLGCQRHCILLNATCPSEAWGGGGENPDGLAYYAVRRGTLIRLPNKLGTPLMPA